VRNNSTRTLNNDDIQKLKDADAVIPKVLDALHSKGQIAAICMLLVSLFLAIGTFSAISATGARETQIIFLVAVLAAVISGTIIGTLRLVKGGQTEFRQSTGFFSGLILLVFLTPLLLNLAATGSADQVGLLLGVLGAICVQFLLVQYAEALETYRDLAAQSDRGWLAIPVFKWSQAMPFMVCLMVMGWGLGLLLADRSHVIIKDSQLVVALLGIGSVTLLVLAVVMFLKPRASWVVERSLQAFAFTGVIGVALVLKAQPLLIGLYQKNSANGTGPAGLLVTVGKLIGRSYLIVSSKSNGGSTWEQLTAWVMAPGLCEEFIKMLPLLFLFNVTRKQSKDPASWYRGFLSVGFSSGLAFGIAESLSNYAPRSGPLPLKLFSLQVLRWYSNVGAHAIWGLTDAAILLIFLEITRGNRRANSIFGWIFTFIAMGLLHGLYDFGCTFGTAPVFEFLSICVMVWMVRKAVVLSARLHPVESPEEEDSSSPMLNGIIRLFDRGILSFSRIYTACLLLAWVALIVMR
jgi:hypothetical protein